MLTDHAILSKMAVPGPRCRLYDPASLGGLQVEIAPCKGGMSAHFRVPVLTDRGTPSIRSIGRYPETPLATARAIALEAKSGKRPDGGHDRARARRRAFFEPLDGSSFESAGLAYVATLTSNTAQHNGRILSMLRTRVFPRIGRRPVSDISLHDIKDILSDVASRHADLAWRLRSILHCVFEHQRFLGGVHVNPVPDMRFIASRPRQKHKSAILDPFEFGDLYAKIKAAPPSPQRDLFLLLPHLMCRSGELRNLRWSDVDMRRMVIRMDISKTKDDPRELLIPMSTQVFVMLGEMDRRGDHVFDSLSCPGRPINESTVARYLHSVLGIDKSVQSPHGFRASARTMIAEYLGIDGVVPEIALGHRVKLPTGNAYHRAIYLDSRREMMQKWSDFIDKHTPV